MIRNAISPGGKYQQIKTAPGDYCPKRFEVSK